MRLWTVTADNITTRMDSLEVVYSLYFHQDRTERCRRAWIDQVI